MAAMRVEAGRSWPLGATWDGRGTNFALFSAHAEKVELCLFDRGGRREIERVALPEHANEVWFGYLPEIRPGTLYGYRVHGPYEPEQGHRFNPHKLLLDPYARQLQGRMVWNDAHFGYRHGHARGDLSFDRRDNARAMPKCRVVEGAFTWDADRPPRTLWRDTVVYELNVRGFTMQNEAVLQPVRGTVAGLSSPAVLQHLRGLGVTAVELLPVHAYFDEPALIRRGQRNLWGYNSIGFFAPEPRLLSTGSIAEFKIMVSRLHEAGIEVILDVVYNHTAEGDENGPTFCFRGIDNASYYQLVPGDPRRYENPTGCGNALNLHHPRVLQMVMDSLRYWVEDMHVDGFRFDLAPTLARGPAGFDPRAPFLAAIAQDPVLQRVKLIAEPWDLGPDGYQVGRFPPGWSEWNDKYRDLLRRFWRGDAGLIGDLAGRITGSQDVFWRGARGPRASVNFVAVHDGFTLHDLVSYGAKRNQANGDGNRDGAGENWNWNHGVDGETDDPAVLAARRRTQRNLLASVLLSQGVPMLLAGDEMDNGQGGNNNAYCQDNPTGWVDWRPDCDLVAFVARLTALRRRFPALARWRHLTGERRPDGLRDIAWLRPDGGDMGIEDWDFAGARSLVFLLAGDHEATGDGQDPLFVAMSAHHDPLGTVLPGRDIAPTWECLLDTSSDAATPAWGICPAGAQIELPPRSLLVFRGR